jgi:hypothetical protein
VRPSAEISAGRGEVASWTVTSRASGSPGEANAWACRVARAFAGAFDHLARPGHGFADVMWLDGAGRVSRVVEGAAATLTQLCDADFDAGVAPPDAAPLVTAFHLDCAALIPGEPPTAEPDGVSFYLGCVVDFDDEERAVPAEYRATVTMHARVRPGDHEKMLTTALRDWERLAGEEITEWVSGSRYGL